MGLAISAGALSHVVAGCLVFMFTGQVLFPGHEGIVLVDVEDARDRLLSLEDTATEDDDA